MTLPTETFAERIKTARLLAGLSQAALGETMRRPYRSICRWETGQSRPTPSGSAALAKALGVSLRWLLTGEGPMESPINNEAPADTRASSHNSAR